MSCRRLAGSLVRHCAVNELTEDAGFKHLVLMFASALSPPSSSSCFICPHLLCIRKNVGPCLLAIHSCPRTLKTYEESLVIKPNSSSFPSVGATDFINLLFIKLLQTIIQKHTLKSGSQVELCQNCCNFRCLSFFTCRVKKESKEHGAMQGAEAHRQVKIQFSAQQMLSGSSITNTFVILGHPWATRSSRSGGKAGSRGCPRSGRSAWEGWRAWDAGEFAIVTLQHQQQTQLWSWKTKRQHRRNGCSPAIDIPVYMYPEWIICSSSYLTSTQRQQLPLHGQVCK